MKEEFAKVILDAQSTAWQVMTFGSKKAEIAGRINPEDYTVEQVRDVIMDLGPLIWNPEILALTNGMLIGALRKSGMELPEIGETIDGLIKEALTSFCKPEDLDEMTAALKMMMGQHMVQVMPKELITGLFEAMKRMHEDGGSTPDPS